MGIYRGVNIIRNGLIAYFDAANFKSFKGEPTINLSYDNGYGGSIYLANIINWINSGNITINANENDIQQPITHIPNLRIISGTVLETGSIHFGCSYATILPLTTYSVSVYFRQNRAGISSPYIRTVVNDNNIGSLKYNGDDNSANWPINEWIRITGTCVTQANENTIYISNYIGTNVGDKIWYFGHQVEQKSYVTPLVAGVRGTTYETGGGWLDLSGNDNHGELIYNPLYDSSNLGNIIFNGINDYINIPINSSIPVNEITFSGWCYPTEGGAEGRIRGGIVSGYVNSYLGLVDSSDGVNNILHWAVNTTVNRSGSWNGVVYRHKWNYLVGTYDGLYSRSYINGEKVSEIEQNGTLTPSNNYYLGTYIGTLVDGIHNFKGKINNVMIYNRSLSQSEILQNYNAQKNRFSI